MAVAGMRAPKAKLRAGLSRRGSELKFEHQAQSNACLDVGGCRWEMDPLCNGFRGSKGAQRGSQSTGKEDRH